MSTLRHATLLALCLLGCGGDAPELLLAQPDFPSFEAEVYPVLLRDCAFIACHGGSERFFQVYGPGRARLPAMRSALEPPSPDEIAFSYNRTLAMIDVENPNASLLLRKPLALGAGGAGHQGVDAWKRDVYVTRQDPGFAVLEAWVLGR